MSTLRIGITATQAGATDEQRTALTALLVGLQPAEVHHGDCVGGDAHSHHIVRQHLPGCRIVIHPPDNPNKRAFCKGDELRRALPYLVRDRIIVLDTDRLVAVPSGPERVRSGTWYTVRQAAAEGRRVTVVWPDGFVEERAAQPPRPPTYAVRIAWEHGDVQVQHHFDPTRPRFEIRRAGALKGTIPATRAWQAERRRAIVAAAALAGIPAP